MGATCHLTYVTDEPRHMAQLDDYINRLESYIQQVYPSINLAQAFGPRPHYGGGGYEPRSALPKALTPATSPAPSPAPSTPLPSDFVSYREATDLPSDAGEDSELDDDPRDGPTFLHRWLNQAENMPGLPRLIGKSGMYSLMQIAFELKGEHDDGAPLEPLKEIIKLMRTRPTVWEVNSVSLQHCRVAASTD